MSITLIIGGARSGKSTKAESIAQKYKDVIYIATTKPDELGMEERILVHKSRRPKSWETIEAYKGFKSIDLKSSAILLDCATLMASNLLFDLEHENGSLDNLSEKEIFDSIIEEYDDLLYSARGAHLIIVSNEIGMGLVSEYKLGNIYRDLMGNINKYIADKADEVILVVAGLDLKLK